MSNTISHDELQELLGFLDVDYGIHVTRNEAERFFEVCENPTSDDFITNFVELLGNLHEIQPLHDGNYVIIDQLVRSHMHICSNDELYRAYDRSISRDEFLKRVSEAICIADNSIIVNGVAYTPALGWLMGCAHYGCTNVIICDKDGFSEAMYSPASLAYLAIGALVDYDDNKIAKIWDTIGLNKLCNLAGYNTAQLKPAVDLSKGTVWEGEIPEFTVYTDDPICSKVCAWALSLK